jgi:hypothetical protein
MYKIFITTTVRDSASGGEFYARNVAVAVHTQVVEFQNRAEADKAISLINAKKGASQAMALYA